MLGLSYGPIICFIKSLPLLRAARRSIGLKCPTRRGCVAIQYTCDKVDDNRVQAARGKWWILLLLTAIGTAHTREPTHSKLEYAPGNTPSWRWKTAPGKVFPPSDLFGVNSWTLTRHAGIGNLGCRWCPDGSEGMSLRCDPIVWEWSLIFINSQHVAERVICHGLKGGVCR